MPSSKSCWMNCHAERARHAPRPDFVGIDAMTLARQLPELGFLNELFSLDSENGVLYWKERPLSTFESIHQGKVWITQNAGKAAGTPLPSGYIRIRIGKRQIMAHRIIFAMFNGFDPVGFEIDHIDGDRKNNSVSNLRLVTSSENKMNLGGAKKGNKSGFLNINWHSIGKKWRAEITVNGKGLYLGLFSDINDAREAVKLSREKYYGEFSSRYSA